MSCAPGHFSRAACVALWVAAVGGPAPAAAEPAFPAGGDDVRLRELVLRKPDGPGDAQELAQAFAGLGPAVLPELFDLQLSSGFEAFLPPELDPATWVVAPDEIPSVALEALARLPKKAVLALLRERMAGEHDLELSLAAARTLGALRSVDGLPLLLGILEGLGTDWSFPHARATLSTALDGVFADPLSPSAVTRQWKGLSPRAQELLAESLLSSSAPAAAEFLLTRLGESPPLDLRILSKVGEPFQREPWRIEALDISGLLRALGSSEAGVRAQAATVIGKLRREDALEELLGHLRDGDMRVQRAVVTTLRAWSGNAGASSPEEWQAWAAQETRWHAESLPELLTAIAPDQPPEAVMAAATELARSPIHRREAVRELVKLLPHASPELGREILRLLVQLQGREAVPGLVDELASSSAGLESDCWKALRALTGADLGADPADWRAWLGL